MVCEDMVFWCESAKSETKTKNKKANCGGFGEMLFNVLFKGICRVV